MEDPFKRKIVVFLNARLVFSVKKPENLDEEKKKGSASSREKYYFLKGNDRSHLIK